MCHLHVPFTNAGGNYSLIIVGMAKTSFPLVLRGSPCDTTAKEAGGPSGPLADNGNKGADGSTLPYDSNLASGVLSVTLDIILLRWTLKTGAGQQEGEQGRQAKPEQPLT